MKGRASAAVFAVGLAGIVAGLVAPRLVEWSAHAQEPAKAHSDASKNGGDLASLQAEVERLKKLLPDQSHVMQDVEYHTANLWFAGEQGNWPLAEFYLSEIKSHLRWAVRIIPVRKDSAGQPVKLEDILQAFENSPLKQLAEAVKAQDLDRFHKAYVFTLEGCYSCHKASSKPYLRPQIPDRLGGAIINTNPNTNWPK